MACRVSGCFCLCLRSPCNFSGHHTTKVIIPLCQGEKQCIYPDGKSRPFSPTDRVHGLQVPNGAPRIARLTTQRLLGRIKLGQAFIRRTSHVRSLDVRPADKYAPLIIGPSWRISQKIARYFDGGR
jgi:hypothetical protein